MQWASGVALAISQSKAQRSPLLVLVEPPTSVTTFDPTSSPQETARNLYARVATRSLHTRVFGNAVVQRAISHAQINCVRFPADEGNSDFQSFSTFFQVKHPTPNLFFIAPDTGRVLCRLIGYVSPVSFRNILENAVKIVSNPGVSIDALTIDTSPNGGIPTTDSTLTHTASTRTPHIAAETSFATHATSSAPANSEKTLPTPQPVKQSLNKTSKLSSTNKAATGVSSSEKSLALPGRARLRARLPNGQQVERSFESVSKFRVVRVWLSRESEISDPSRLILSIAFPRHVFSPADDPKQLGELGLLPSATIVVALPPTEDGASPRTSVVSSIASSAAAVVSSFVRSFISPTQQPNQNSQQSVQDDVQGARNTRRGDARNGPPSPVRMTQIREDADDNDDSQQWFSNGNSTQFGWNPADVDDEQT